MPKNVKISEWHYQINLNARKKVKISEPSTSELHSKLLLLLWEEPQNFCCYYEKSHKTSVVIMRRTRHEVIIETVDLLMAQEQLNSTKISRGNWVVASQKNLKGTMDV